MRLPLQARPVRRILQCLALSTAIGMAFGATSMQAQPAAVLKIQILDARGTEIAASTKTDFRRKQVRLNFVHSYRPGDRIVATGPAQIAVQIDSGLRECSLYRESAGVWSFMIPFGHSQKEAGGVYDPGVFQGEAHNVSARVLTRRELRHYRNLALNPCDQEEQQTLIAYPHATANSVYRAMPVFAPRNAIDGVAAGGHHGGWPYQSWGPDKVGGLWWRLDFGRTVELDKLRIALRSDFPHDSYWKEATLEFSDGVQQRVSLGKTAALQEIRFPSHRTAWIRLSHLVPAEEPGWCALTEVEAWGKDLR
ncbi:MAG: discoidin domain-containing protein [Terracidiphilus sp.]|nr:discoidin domain-containing protein [Terracidiphilus sp.]